MNIQRLGSHARITSFPVNMAPIQRVGYPFILFPNVTGVVVQVRQELLVQGRDLTVHACGFMPDEATKRMDEAEREQLQEQRRNGTDRGAAASSGGTGGSGGSGAGTGAAACGGGGRSKGGSAAAWLDGPWMSTEVKRIKKHLFDSFNKLVEHLGDGGLRLGEDGSCVPVSKLATLEVERAEGFVVALLLLLRDEGSVAGSHLGVELLLQEVQPGRVDRLVPGREEARAAEAAEARDAKKAVVPAAARAQATKAQKKVMKQLMVA